MKKIIYITTINLSDNSAQSLQIKSMANAFSILCDKFFLYSFNKITGEKENCNYYFLNNRGGKLIRTLKITSFVFSKNKGGYNVMTRDILIALAFTVLGKNVLWESHQETSKISKNILRFLNFFNNFKVLTISEALKNSSEIPIKKDRIYFYHDGCDSCNFSGKTAFLKKKTALYTGALHKGKDVDSLFPLFDFFPDWNFLFIGGNPSEVAKYKLKSKKYLNVKFIGRVNHDDVISFQRSADVLLFPLTKTNKLWRYTSPLKLFEYMKAGKPIVASNIGSVSEILNKENAFVYQDEDVVDAFMKFTKTSSEDLNKMIRLNDELIKKKYNWISRSEFILEDIFNEKK